MVTKGSGDACDEEHETCIFPCKVAAGGDEGYLLCAAGAAAVVLVPPLCSATSGCSCVRSSMRFLNLWSTCVDTCRFAT